MRACFANLRIPTFVGADRRRNVLSLTVLIAFVAATLLPLVGSVRAEAAGTSYGGGQGGGSGGLSGLPVLGVHAVGSSATTLTFNISMATVTVHVPAKTFAAHSQIAILNAISLASAPEGYGSVAFAYDVVGKNASGTFLNTFPHAILISISSTLITGRQFVFKLSNNAWTACTPATNASQSLSYYEASGLALEVVNPGSVTTTTHPRATTTTTHPRATTTTTRPRATTTTRPRTTTTTRPKATTTTKPKVTTTTRPKATTTTKPKVTTTTRPKATTTTKPKSTTTTSHRGTTTTTRKGTTTTRPKSTTTTSHKGVTTTTKPKKSRAASAFKAAHVIQRAKYFSLGI